MASQRCSLCAVNYPAGYSECLRCGGRLRSCTDPPSDHWRDVDVGAAGTEGLKVETWRLHVLLEAGYPTALAEQLARGSNVDLHFAVELVTSRGCKPELAAEILL